MIEFFAALVVSLVLVLAVNLVSLGIRTTEFCNMYRALGASWILAQSDEEKQMICLKYGLQIIWGSLKLLAIISGFALLIASPIYALSRLNTEIYLIHLSWMTLVAFLFSLKRAR